MASPGRFLPPSPFRQPPFQGQSFGQSFGYPAPARQPFDIGGQTYGNGAETQLNLGQGQPQFVPGYRQPMPFLRPPQQQITFPRVRSFSAPTTTDQLRYHDQQQSQQVSGLAMLAALVNALQQPQGRAPFNTSA